MNSVHLTVSEARAILAVDESLTDFLLTDSGARDRKQGLRDVLGSEETFAAWETLVDSAIGRVKTYESQRRKP